MRLTKFNEFSINENLDKDALEEILRGWGVFNPPQFFQWLEDHGYTIVELEPVGHGVVENFNDFIHFLYGLNEASLISIHFRLKWLQHFPTNALF